MKDMQTMEENKAIFTIESTPQWLVPARGNICLPAVSREPLV